MSVSTPASNDAKFERLPREVLIIVCEGLFEAHRPSLAPFALTSKACRRAADVIQHRHVQLTFEEPQRLSDDFESALERTSTHLQRTRASLSQDLCLG